VDTDQRDHPRHLGDHEERHRPADSGSIVRSSWAQMLRPYSRRDRRIWLRQTCHSAQLFSGQGPCPRGSDFQCL
jgi:hypothetical protein